MPKRTDSRADDDVPQARNRRAVVEPPKEGDGGKVVVRKAKRDVVVRSAKPTLTNRGAAGLLEKVPEGIPLAAVVEAPRGKRDNIAKELLPLARSIASLTPDPDNARLHGERNVEAIKDSLRTFGQVKPLVVRKKGMVVVAGNGTLEAAKALGWTKVAATVVDFGSEAKAASYGLADNRTSELASWDMEVVKRIDALVLEAGLPTIGFSVEELSVLRVGDWVPPPTPPPQQFPEVDESIEVEHQCPKCGYFFSGGSTRPAGSGEDGLEDDEEAE